MGEIKNNRLFNNYFNSTFGGKTGKNDVEEYMEEKIRISLSNFNRSVKTQEIKEIWLK